MNENTVLFNLATNGVAEITLNRPQKHNALDNILVQKLSNCLDEIQQNPNIRTVCIKAAGKTFCAGADLAWMKKTANSTMAENKQDATELAYMFYKLYNLKVPTICLVQGPTYGGGVGIVACCDIAIATTAASFCLSEVKIGLTPSVISPYILQAIGSRAANRFCLTAETINADKSLAIGLIHELVTPEQLSVTANRLISQLLRNGPLAIQKTKSDLLKNNDISQDVLDYTIEHIATTRTSGEAQEGLSAFLQKRTPNWVME